MDRLFPWQRQLCECERLICQREAVLSEVRDRSRGEVTHLPFAYPNSPCLVWQEPTQVTVWPAETRLSQLSQLPLQRPHVLGN